MLFVRTHHSNITSPHNQINKHYNVAPWLWPGSAEESQPRAAVSAWVTSRPGQAGD